MKELNNIFTDQSVNDVSEKILKLTIEKIKDSLSNEFYNQMSGFIYEHYENARDSIERGLIDEITDNFIDNPLNYKYTKLRKKIFDENRDVIIPLLTREAIESSVENIIWDRLSDNYHFSWRWRESVVKMIVENIDTILSNEKIGEQGLLREIGNMKRRIAYLENELSNREMLSDEYR